MTPGQDTVRSAFTRACALPLAPREVQANTNFNHVEGLAQPHQRSGRPSPRAHMNHDIFEPTLGAASSANDGLPFNGDARREYVLGLLCPSANPQPLGPSEVPTELVVKNTFIHVEDVAKPLRRSKSDSDLSGKCASRSSLESVELTPRAPGFRSDTPGGGASSSANEDTATKAAVPTCDSPLGTTARGFSWAHDDTDDDHQDQEDWSVGSAKHGANECTPCLYYPTKKGCKNGRNCHWCHMPHQSSMRARPNKAQRNRCKRIVRLLGSDNTDDPDELAEDLCKRAAIRNSATSERAYLHGMLVRRAQQQEGRREQHCASSSSSAPNEVRRRRARP